MPEKSDHTDILLWILVIVSVILLIGGFCLWNGWFSVQCETVEKSILITAKSGSTKSLKNSKSDKEEDEEEVKKVLNKHPLSGSSKNSKKVAKVISKDTSDVSDVPVRSGVSKSAPKSSMKKDVRSGYKLECGVSDALEQAIKAAQAAGGDAGAIRAAASRLAAEYADRGSKLAPMIVASGEQQLEDRESAEPFSGQAARNAPLGDKNGGPEMPMADAPMSQDSQEACEAGRLAVQLVNDLYGKDGVYVPLPSSANLNPTYADAVDAFKTSSTFESSLGQTGLAISVDSNGNSSVPIDANLAKLTAGFNVGAMATQVAKTGYYTAPPAEIVDMASKLEIAHELGSSSPSVSNGGAPVLEDTRAQEPLFDPALE